MSNTDASNTTTESEVHHFCGNSIEPGGQSKGCAHSDSELRDYINFGKLPNPDCPQIKEWNKP